MEKTFFLKYPTWSDVELPSLTRRYIKAPKALQELPLILIPEHLLSCSVEIKQHHQFIQKAIQKWLKVAQRDDKRLRIERSFLQKYDVNMVILDQKMDLSNPQGKLMLNMLGVLAEWEVDLLSERIKRGKEHQRKQIWANGSCPFGLVVIDHQYFLDLTPFLCLLTDRPENYRDVVIIPKM